MDYISRFAELSIKRFNTLDSEMANKFYDELQNIAVIMNKEGIINELECLFTHERPEVRCNAAIALLPFCSTKAEAILEELARKRGSFVYLEARMTLKEWRKGNIKFEYYKK